MLYLLYGLSFCDQLIESIAMFFALTLLFLIGNFLSSLNISFNIMMYGSPRNFWDGLDEKAVQRVKGKLTHLNLASRLWLATILDKVTREQTFRMMLEKRCPGHKKEGG
jgi:hypothetical protein